MFKIRMLRSRQITRTALFAAVYAVLTIVLAPISYGPLQLRAAEAMTVLPALFPEAVPGLFIGCFIANLFGGNGILDVIFGSLATLAAAFLTRKMKSPWLIPLPPVVINALVVATVLTFTTGLPWPLIALEVGAGQLGSCYVLGLPLYFMMNKRLAKKEDIQ